VVRKHRAALTTAQFAAFLAYCRRDLPDATPHERATATVLALVHTRRRATPAGWLPDILYAHGLPLLAKALDDILTYGEVMPF
jgi:hypothetical protein